ncbi:MAG: GntR family transcriptional regulator [Ruminococcus sp.]|nr:GntR family transcriptional regulator [Ruminococcus sp.]MDE7098913.1 GntR family transcriptional regulator [Ruminococcus sp.]
MKIVIKNKSELPIYEQIEQQMKAQILDGTVTEDEQLPSIRQLARDLKISVITTTRVYNDLADEGFIISVSGKGYFVAPRNNELLRERMLYEMEDGLEKAVTNGRNAGLTDDEIVTALRKFMED